MIYNHSNGGEIIFKRDDNYYYFLRKQYEHMSSIWQLISWCLLPDCYIMLVKIKNDFPQEMHWLVINKIIYSKFGHFTNGYAKAINKSYGRRGSIFAKGFRRILLDNDNLKGEITKMHFLPIRNRLVESPFDWKFSSCNKVHQYSNDPQLIEMLKAFGSLDNFLIDHHSKKIENIAA